jgi:TolB protein
MMKGCEMRLHRPVLWSLVAGALVLVPTTPAGMFSAAPSGTFEIASEPLTPQQREVEISMRGVGGRTPRLGVPEFVVTGADADTREAAATVAQVLWSDLEFEREFTMIDRAAAAQVPVQPVERLPYATWNELGADFVLVGNASRSENTLTVEVRLMSVERKLSAFGKRYACSMRDPRYCAHTIADEIHKDRFNLDGIARTKLAFVSDRDGERLGGTIEERQIKEIYISDYDGGKQMRLTPHRTLNIAPSWSPDNRFLTYTSYLSGFPDVVVQSIYEARPLQRPAKGTPNQQNYLPKFSPDGARIAFASSRTGNFEIYTMRVDGSDLRQLTSHPGADNAPTWSPTGQQIAFTSDRSGSNQIYIMSADGGPVTRIASGSNKVDKPTWSPAPFNYIAFTAEVPGGHHVRMYDFATQQVTTLTEALRGSNESPAVAPNGRHIAIVTTHYGKEHIAIIGRDGKLERRITTAGNNKYPAWSNR